MEACPFPPPSILFRGKNQGYDSSPKMASPMTAIAPREIDPLAEALLCFEDAEGDDLELEVGLEPVVELLEGEDEAEEVEEEVEVELE